MQQDNSEHVSKGAHFSYQHLSQTKNIHTSTQVVAIFAGIIIIAQVWCRKALCVELHPCGFITKSVSRKPSSMHKHEQKMAAQCLGVREREETPGAEAHLWYEPNSLSLSTPVCNMGIITGWL